VPIEPPTHEDLAASAERYRFDLDADAVATFAPLVEGLLSSYDRVEALYAEQADEGPRRAWSTPTAEENYWGAWYVTCDIEGPAEGLLAGQRVAIKDNTAVAGIPMMNGSKTVEGFVPKTDATVVTRLLGAGATIAGKAVCEDLCFSGASHTSASGPVHNPWDPTRTTGGSSSGSAALVASGDVDLATGGDQGGSVRMPAAMCGIVGHKPTHGLVPYTGAFPIEVTIDHVGPMTRTVAEAAAMLGVMAGVDGLDPRQPDHVDVPDYLAALSRGVDGMRVGVVTEGFGHEGLSQEPVDDTVRAAFETLRSLGMVVEDVSVPWHRTGLDIWNVIATDGATAQMLDGNGYGLNWDGLYDPDLIAHYGAGRLAHGAELSDTVKLVGLAGRHSLDAYHGRHYAMARNLVPTLRAAYDAALEDHDVLIMPTVPILPSVLVDSTTPRVEGIARALEMIVNTASTDVTGHPATSVPAGLGDGLPVGMMIIGRRFEDATCLQVARAFEAAVGGFPSPPVRTAVQA